MAAGDKSPLRSKMRYEGNHILPESWWESLPPFAQAMWKKTYKEAQDAEDPAEIAWDRIRTEWVRDRGTWTMKADLPGYRESSDGSLRVWMGQEGDWVGQLIPLWSLDLPGNRYVPKLDVEQLPEEARKVYTQAHERGKRNGDGDPHGIACNVLRREFEKTKEGWVKRSAQEVEYRQHRWIREVGEVERPIWDEIAADKAAEGLERISTTEYAQLPERLRRVYREAYKIVLKNGSRHPVADAWKHIIAKYERNEDSWSKRSPPIQSIVERLYGGPLKE